MAATPSALVTATTTYTRLGAVDTTTETANGTIRTSTSSYDSAGRPVKNTLTSALGSPLDAVALSTVLVLIARPLVAL